MNKTCTWCGTKNIEGDKCPRYGLGGYHLKDPSAPHNPDWSRNTISTWICKVCDLVVDPTKPEELAKHPLVSK